MPTCETHHNPRLVPCDCQGGLVYVLVTETDPGDYYTPPSPYMVGEYTEVCTRCQGTSRVVDTCTEFGPQWCDGSRYVSEFNNDDWPL